MATVLNEYGLGDDYRQTAKTEGSVTYESSLTGIKVLIAFDRRGRPIVSLKNRDIRIYRLLQLRNENTLFVKVTAPLVIATIMQLTLEFFFPDEFGSTVIRAALFFGALLVAMPACFFAPKLWYWWKVLFVASRLRKAYQGETRRVFLKSALLKLSNSVNRIKAQAAKDVFERL